MRIITTYEYSLILSMDFVAKPIESFAHWAMALGTKRVYNFHEGGTPQDLALLGSKGVSMCELTQQQVSVPPGFIITTETSIEWSRNGMIFPEGLVHEYTSAIHDLERQTGLTYGTDKECPPLLLAIRSGSSVAQSSNEYRCTDSRTYIALPESWSMPGISKTILNVGLNEKMAHTLARNTTPKFALDSYARHLMSFGTIVYGLDTQCYSSIMEECKANRGGDLSISDLQYIIQQFKMIKEIPEDPWEQVINNIAVASKLPQYSIFRVLFS